MKYNIARDKLSSCEGKKRHDSQNNAILQAKKLKFKKSEAFEVYFCRFCNGWHVGHVFGRKW